MLICMKPTSKHLNVVQRDLARNRSLSRLSNAEISHIPDVHPSQIGRICGGQFKTLSFIAVQNCKVLGVVLPRVVVSSFRCRPVLGQGSDLHEDTMGRDTRRRKGNNKYDPPIRELILGS